MKNKMRPLTFIALLLIIILTACSNSASLETNLSPQLSFPEEGEDIAVVKTNHGTFLIRLFDEIEPDTVAFFKENVSSGYYNGLEMFRALNPKDPSVFVNDMHIEKDYLTDPFFEPQKHDSYKHYTGAVGITRHAFGYGKKSYCFGTSFYIVAGSPLTEEELEILVDLGCSEEVVKTYQSVGGMPWVDFDRENPIIGHVFSGLEIVQKIEPMLLDPDPTNPVVIESIKIKPYNEEEDLNHD